MTAAELQYKRGVLDRLYGTRRLLKGRDLPRFKDAFARNEELIALLEKARGSLEVQTILATHERMDSGRRVTTPAPTLNT